MLRLEGVSGGYGTANVLEGIALHVGRGEAVALLGPNGAGKSTLLGAVTGTIPRRAGSIVFDGQPIDTALSHSIVVRGLVLVPEGRQIFAPMTVLDNLRLGAIRTPRRHHAERLAGVFRLFPRLDERKDQVAGTLSGGEQQMLAIGRALMSGPRMLLLDEPFLGLAPLVIDEIWAALNVLKAQGLTLLLVEQKVDMALEMTSRAYVMVKGRIVLSEACADLARRESLQDIYFAQG